jgi:homoaconitate hydratase
MFRHTSRRSRGVRLFATQTSKIPQTVIEKVVQKYAVGLPAGKVVKAGDYVMIRPEHVMTHDNTGPVISKYAVFTLRRTVRAPGMHVS